MVESRFKFRIKGHESFYIREGWFRKGIKAIKNDNKIFSSDNATDVLGMGTNMVKSLRFWLQASGITEEKVVKGSKREQHLTENFGQIIDRFDPYFEDIFTLWLIHYKLAKNRELCTSWYLFFNEFTLEEFTKEQMIYSLNLALKRLTNNSDFSEKSLLDDCDCIIKTYYEDTNKERNPEENTICPLTELGLITLSKDKRNPTYIKNKPNINKLDRLVVLYIIIDNLNNNMSTSIDKLLNDNGNLGKVLNFDRNILNEYIDILKNEGYVQINRTAGLDIIYINEKITITDVLMNYYQQQ